MLKYVSNAGKRMGIHFLAFNHSLLLLGEHIGRDAIRNIIGEDNHRAKGCGHKTKSDAT